MRPPEADLSRASLQRRQNSVEPDSFRAQCVSPYSCPYPSVGSGSVRPDRGVKERAPAETGREESC